MTAASLELANLKLSNVKPSPLNPRKNFDDASFNDLVDSVTMEGVLQPITVREVCPDAPNASNYFEIVMGERRFRAAQIAGLETIPALIRQGETSDAELVEMALIENLQRNNLNAIEEGDGFAKMLELSPNLTQADLAHRLGKSQSYISNAMRLRDLPQEVKEMLGRETLQRAHAVALVAIADQPECTRLAQKAVRENMTQKDVEEAVKTVKDTQKAKDQPTLLDVPKEEPKAAGMTAQDMADVDAEEERQRRDSENGELEYDAGGAHFDDDEEGDALKNGLPKYVPPSVTEKVTTTETTKHETLTTAAAKPATATVPTISPLAISESSRAEGNKAANAYAATLDDAPSSPKSNYSAPNNAAPVPAKPKAPVLKTPYGDVDTSLCNDVLTSDALFVLVALNDDWNKKHAGEPDKHTDLAQRLEIILLTRAGAADIDTDELLDIKEKAEQEAGIHA